jgi:hypothetical protein
MRSISSLRSIACAAALCLCASLALSACHVARIEPFGESKVDALCNDQKRCEAHGDKVLNLLNSKKQARLYLAPGKGPEQLLGKVAPKRKADSVMKTCGAEIKPDDWLAAPEGIREFALGKHGKDELRRRLRAYLSARVPALSFPQGRSVEASLSAVIDAVSLERVSWVSQTYWLTDTAYERRVGQCGEDERENIIYSLTLLSPSQAFQVDLADKLVHALESQLKPSTPDANPAASETEADSSTAAEGQPSAASEPSAEPPPASTHENVAYDVVRALARDTRVVAALGCDDV